MSQMNSYPTGIEKLSIDTIRTLSMDGVQKANSGHPGTPMALAPVVHTLWQEFLRYDPADARWADRDRFVLSCGHASMLLYSTLHLAGVKELDHGGKPTGRLAVPMEELQRFRQLGSRTPGHPEAKHTTGVETTTGPLGQGVANSVGMAMAQKWLAARYNKPGFELFRHHVWVLNGDGDFMEGVSYEAASLAGHLGLGNLTWIYDNNRITIEGETHLAFSEDVATRFVAQGWNVTRVADANDTAMLRRAMEWARKCTDRPTLIIVDSHIGFGSPKKQDSHAAHGEPLGADEIQATKKVYGWPETAPFFVPDGVREHWAANVGQRGAKLSAEWKQLFDAYQKQFPALAAELDLVLSGELPSGWEKSLPTFPADAKGLATRDASGKAINAVAPAIPWLVGGSADLAPSTKTLMTFPEAGHFSAHAYGGRNLHFGIREHVMGSILNGMALSGLRAYGATFLIFSDYLRPTLRLASLMELPIIEVFTHDSIGVGEDGPTHQPIEQLASLRAIPGLITLRPCDANETAEAWKVALSSRTQPVALALTRQALPTLDRTKYASASGLAKGGYVLVDAQKGAPQLVLIGTGSEVSLCLAAREKLESEGIATRVVSLPSWELFEKQPQAYKDSVLPPDCKARVAVEMASTFGWKQWVGDHGAVIGMTSFGASAPLPDLQRTFGFTVENVVATAKKQLALATAS
ncbi:MAG: transketolase [Planctomycetes bacterium]|nr:transketolase [Planctomycetota bacterium]